MYYKVVGQVLLQRGAAFLYYKVLQQIVEK